MEISIGLSDAPFVATNDPAPSSAGCVPPLRLMTSGSSTCRCILDITKHRTGLWEQSTSHSLSIPK
ncbi:hypothetical protein M5D96_003590 [Drosophila gunungcola]|uniref:Uncharacterized protein n=1 Tax=Drosophila gunungcola TaxID=103775 RepID=A0A9P9YSH0_9MUSC|nr:hypothetical protein M5D96_003590 [Drosophila gunungcola]